MEIILYLVYLSPPSLEAKFFFVTNFTAPGAAEERMKCYQTFSHSPTLTDPFPSVGAQFVCKGLARNDLKTGFLNCTF